MIRAIRESHDLVTKSGLPYAVCGGFAIDMFLNRVTRKHTDFDITIFEENRQDILNYMLNQNWEIFEHIWDDPKNDHLVAINSADEERALRVPCVWAVKPGCTLLTVQPKDKANNIYSWKMASGNYSECDFIEICFDERKNGRFICNKELGISRPMDKAILHNDGIPYLAPEVILYHKSHPVYQAWPKTIFDAYQVAHLLDDESRGWLVEALNATYPDGHEWLKRLCAFN